MIGKFTTGMKNEIAMQANRDGTCAFNLENALGTILHAGIGVAVGLGLRKAFPNRPRLSALAKGDKTAEQSK